MTDKEKKKKKTEKEENGGKQKEVKAGTAEDEVFKRQNVFTRSIQRFRKNKPRSNSCASTRG